MAFVAPMETWEIVGGGLPPLRVRARSFSDALVRAKAVNPGYCGGYIVEED